MDWSAVRVGTGVFHNKCGSGNILQINYAQKTCTIRFLNGEQKLTFQDMINDGYKVLIWVTCK